MSDQTKLLKQRRYLPLFLCQFLGAFNDNFFRNATLILLSFHAASWSTLDSKTLPNLVQGIFILPFFFFSALSGQLADKYDKARIARIVKVLEIIIMCIAILGFMVHSAGLLFLCLFLLGLHSTLFGPVKYAILPQVLNEEELVGGNALIEASTFIAILVGTICGGVLAAVDNGLLWVGGFALFIAVIGYGISWFIPSVPSPQPELKVSFNILVETWRNISFARRRHSVFMAILGASWSWAFGALFMAQAPGYAKDVLGGSESALTLLMAAFTIGIGVGSVLCEKLSGKRVELGLVPFGAIGLTWFAIDLYFASPNSLPPNAPLELKAFLSQPGIIRILFDIFLLGIFGGFYVVPIYAMIQLRSPEEYRARIIAANNIFNALFMVGGALFAVLVLSLGISIPVLLALIGIINAVVAIYIFTLVPEFLLRFVIWLLVHTIYRLRSDHIERIPERGAALLIANHVSYVDRMMIAAACRRPIAFAVQPDWFDSRFFAYFMRQGKAFAWVPGNDPEPILKALRHDQLVCIFPENGITVDGEIKEFAPELTSVLTQIDVPIIPLALTGLWGSFFSKKPGNALAKLWYGFRCPVVLFVGEAIRSSQIQLSQIRETIVQMLEKHTAN